MAIWAVYIPGKKWFGEVPVEVLPLLLRDEGELAPESYLVESVGLWEVVDTEEEARKIGADQTRGGSEYRVWKQVLRIGTSVVVLRQIERKKVQHADQSIFNLLEFLEVLGEGLGMEKTERTPMDPVEFQRYVISTLRSWSDEVGTVSEAWGEKYIKFLEAQDWSQMTPEEIDAEFERMAKVVPVEVASASASMVSSGNKHSFKLSMATREGTIKMEGLKVESSFTLKDVKTIDRMSTWSFKQIPVSYVKMADRLSRTIQKELVKGLETGEHYRKVVAEVAKKTPAIVTRQQVNFLTVTAQTALARARTQSQLMTYRDAEVTVLWFRAVMDERTTPQCSWNDGQIISVEPALAYAEKALAANEDPREAFPWVTNRKDQATGDEWLEFSQGGSAFRFADKDDKGQFQYREGWNMKRLQSHGVGLPPLHAMCRSTVSVSVEYMSTLV